MSVLERRPAVRGADPEGTWSTRLWVWFAFCVGALLLLDVVELRVWAAVVVVVGAALAAVPALRPHVDARVDVADLVAVGVTYAAVVTSFVLAFRVFTTDNVLGLFLCFAAGMLIGVVGPVVYQVWGRGRDLHSLGLGAQRWRQTVVIGIVLAATQFAVTMLGLDLPAPEEWVPLLGMSLVVGLFEAVFFRGFVQGRLESSFGAVPAVAGAAVLYAGYHVGYGMGLSDMWFLLALGVVYAVAYRLTTNIYVIWPLLTPVGAFFNNLNNGDIELPWASLLGFADVAVLMVAAIWVAHRRIGKVRAAAPPATPDTSGTPDG